MIVRFSGFGGQGIILMGYIYGTSAVMEGKNVIQTQSYGSEARGGACKSDVIISESEIYELTPSDLDILIAMSQVALEKFVPDLKEDGILIFDNDLVKINEKRLESQFSVYGISATDIAFKKFGKKIVGNMVMLGFMTAVTDLDSKDVVRDVIERNVPKGTGKMNVEAFMCGYNQDVKEKVF